MKNLILKQVIQWLWQNHDVVSELITKIKESQSVKK